jgi:hypothetical protein
MAKFGGEALLDNQSSETQTLSGPVQGDRHIIAAIIPIVWLILP